MNDASAITQQIFTTGEMSEGARKRAEAEALKIKERIDAAGATLHEGCTAEAHAAATGLALQNAQQVDFVKSDIADTNSKVDRLTDSVDTMSTGIQTLTTEVRKNGGCVIPIPLKGGKTIPLPARYVFAVFVCLLLFLGWLIGSDNLGEFVTVWKEVKAIRSDSAAVAPTSDGAESRNALAAIGIEKRIRTSTP